MKRRIGFYEKYIKRGLDIALSLLALAAFGWLFALIALLVRINMGSPVIFRQPRPGIIDPETGRETIFDMYKFRTMTDARDKDGRLLPDSQRLPKFGRMLRASSLDELPEFINILKGDMSFIGPRPQLVRDMVFMSDRVRMRHTARPGLTGLAQVNGRNAITWEQKFEWDLKYISDVSLAKDTKIALLTFKKVFGRGKSSAETEVTDDYGDALLKAGKVSREEYEALQAKALRILEARK